jgi:Ni/Co efflux regulator RcnB
MTRHALLSGLTAVAVGLLAAPAAQADDASLFSAYNARQGEVKAASDVYVRALKRNHKHPNNKTLRGIIRADHGINTVLTTIKVELAAQQASSTQGRKARASAFREVRWWRRANNIEIHGIRLLMHNHDAAATHAFNRATHTVRRAYRQGRLAVRHFKAAGLTSPLGPISKA